MREGGTRAAGEDGAHEASASRQAGVAHRVDAPVDPVKLPAAASSQNSALGQAGREQLRQRRDSVLAPGELGDPGPGRAARRNRP